MTGKLKPLVRVESSTLFDEYKPPTTGESSDVAAFMSLVRRAVQVAGWEELTAHKVGSAGGKEQDTVDAEIVVHHLSNDYKAGLGAPAIDRGESMIELLVEGQRVRGRFDRHSVSSSKEEAQAVISFVVSQLRGSDAHAGHNPTRQRISAMIEDVAASAADLVDELDRLGVRGSDEIDKLIELLEGLVAELKAMRFGPEAPETADLAGAAGQLGRALRSRAARLLFGGALLTGAGKLAVDVAGPALGQMASNAIEADAGAAAPSVTVNVQTATSTDELDRCVAQLDRATRTLEAVILGHTVMQDEDDIAGTDAPGDGTGLGIEVEPESPPIRWPDSPPQSPET